MSIHASIHDWLDQFAACVRNRDLEGGKTLFAAEVQAFGTRAEIARNLAELIENQWSPIWFQTRGFRFLNDTISTLASDDETLVCVLVLWTSEGVGTADAAFPRRGRCTLLLRRNDSRPHGYVAVHSHFSKTPSGEV